MVYTISHNCIENRTRKEWIRSMLSTGDMMVLNDWAGGRTTDDNNHYVYSTHIVPADFSSNGVLKVLVQTLDSGNLRCSISAKHAAHGEAHNQHAASTGWITKAISNSGTLYVLTTSLSLPSLAKEDFIAIVFGRAGADALDTITGDVCIIGFILEYTADM